MTNADLSEMNLGVQHKLDLCGNTSQYVRFCHCLYESGGAQIVFTPE